MIHRNLAAAIADLADERAGHGRRRVAMARVMECFGPGEFLAALVACYHGRPHAHSRFREIAHAVLGDFGSQALPAIRAFLSAHPGEAGWMVRPVVWMIDVPVAERIRLLNALAASGDPDLNAEILDALEYDSDFWDRCRVRLVLEEKPS